MSRLKRKRRKVGEVVLIDYGRDASGQFWWIERSDPTSPHGPFPTEAEAQKDSEVTLFGGQCEIRDGGQWDPAWDRKQ